MDFNVKASGDIEVKGNVGKMCLLKGRDMMFIIKQGINGKR